MVRTLQRGNGGGGCTRRCCIMPLGQGVNPADIAVIKKEVAETEHHLHNFEKWLQKATTATGETHVADRMGGTKNPFQLTSGSSAFGSWVLVLGSTDTPIQPTMTKFDLHKIMVVETSDDAPFVVQIVTGESAGIAAKLVVENFDEFPFQSISNRNDSGITDVIDRRADSGEKVWMRCACQGENAKTIDLIIGIHEYKV